jgi:hypothetical protein
MDAFIWVLGSAVAGAVVLAWAFLVSRRAKRIRLDNIERQVKAAAIRRLRVLIVAPTQQWCREIMLAHRERYHDEYGDEVPLPTYRYITREEQLRGMDNCTILVYSKSHRDGHEIRMPDIQQQLDRMQAVGQNVGIQYVTEEYYR